MSEAHARDAGAIGVAAPVGAAGLIVAAAVGARGREPDARDAHPIAVTDAVDAARLPVAAAAARRVPASAGDVPVPQPVTVCNLRQCRGHWPGSHGSAMVARGRAAGPTRKASRPS